MRDREELKRRLEAAGLSSVAERIVALARPCYRIERMLTPEDQIPIGASKFGGLPDVPAGFVWPQIEGKRHPEPVEFVGQIRLADLPDPLPEPLPRDGLLSFFTRWSEGQVFYFPQGATLERSPSPNPQVAPAPEGFWQKLKAEFKRNPDPRQTYRACTLNFVHAFSAPDGDHSTIKALNLSDEDSEAYAEQVLESPEEPPAATHGMQHQMFGHARPVQNEMELECDHTRSGATMRWDLPQERFIAASQNWVLLLQMDTDDYKEGPGWMWGDAGMLYFWIHRDDLAARAFEKSVFISQCC